MQCYHQPIDLILQPTRNTAQAKSPQRSVEKRLRDAGIPVRKTSSPPMPKKLAARGTAPRQVIETRVMDTEVNPWDLAHLSFEALGDDARFVEPDSYQSFTVDRKVTAKAKDLDAGDFGSGRTDDNVDPDWPPAKDIVWHLGDDFSQLASARNIVAGLDTIVRIAHLDTGYARQHVIIPDSVKEHPLQRNFVRGEQASDAYDRLRDGMLRQPGHGTGTFGILGGGRVKLDSAQGVFEDYLGAAWFAEIIPLRISKTVILLKTSAFADAVDYLIRLTLNGTPVHVATMSMGGAPSQAWVDAVNAAYDAGIFLVSAAGNNFGGLPTRNLVYPARFGRVLAACGVTHDYKPYLHRKVTEMQGCFGPERYMDTAMAAFTPNIPWASVESKGIRFSGAGTSSATPQLAAAAGIYYRKHARKLDRLKPWQRVEAIRHALFQSARKTSGHSQYDARFRYYFGQGILQAKDALAVPVTAAIQPTPGDQLPWFPVLDTIFKTLPSPHEQQKLQMLNTELAQLVYDRPELAALIDENLDMEAISRKQWARFRDAVIAHPDASVTLSKHLESGKTNVKH